MTDIPRDARCVMGSRVEGADETDFYPTPPWGGRAAGELIKRLDPAARSVWEPACGAGHMVHGLADHFDQVFASDAFNYGWGHGIYDFLSPAPAAFAPDWVITNPPFREKVEPFIRLGYARARRGCAMLLQLRALEGKARHALFQDVPLTLLANFADRLPMARGRYVAKGSTATAYALFVFQKPTRRGERPPERRSFTIPPGSDKRLFRLSDLAFAVRGSAGHSWIAALPPGATITQAKFDALVALAACGARGSCAVTGVMDGSHLAWLVQFGLAERTAPDRLGGNRYRASANGRAVVQHAGLG